MSYSRLSRALKSECFSPRNSPLSAALPHKVSAESTSMAQPQATCFSFIPGFDNRGTFRLSKSHVKDPPDTAGRHALRRATLTWLTRVAERRGIHAMIGDRVDLLVVYQRDRSALWCSAAPAPAGHATAR